MTTEIHWLPLFSGNASWRAKHAHLFQSDESLRFYLRTHKAELVKAGALVSHRGQWHATEKMAPTVAAIAQRAARRAVESDA